MDAYEATKMVFSRIQALDPDNAATVMGVLLIQDPGEQEMIRLAFGPDSLLGAVINESLTKHHPNQGGAAPPPGAVSPPHPFFSPSPPPDFDDDPLLCDGLHNAVVGPRGGPMMSPAHPSPDHAGGRCHYFSRGYCKNGPACRFFHHHHHACVPPPPMNAAAAAGAATGGATVNYNDTDDGDYYHTQLHNHQQSTTLLSSPRLSPNTTQHQLNAPPSSFGAPSPKSSLATLNHLLRLQHLHSHQRRLVQRAEDEETAAATTLRLFDMRAAHYSSPDMLSPASRQIYLTFPADSTFTEEDVSNYFTIYGPVQDVRIPYQQKRMFGFVSFVYPETVRMVLAKGNPHFVCDSRVLVKPYKEKPKLRDTNRKPLMSGRSDFSVAGVDDTPYHQIGFHPLQGSRMMLSGTQEAAAAVLLRRKMMEEDHQHQQQAAVAATAFHQAIELQRKRFAGLQVLDLNNHHRRDVSSPVPVQPVSSLSPSPIVAAAAAGTATLSGVANGTDQQGSCFLPGSDGYAPDRPPTTIPAEDAVTPEVVGRSDIDKENLEKLNIDEDTESISSTGMPEVAAVAAAAAANVRVPADSEGCAKKETCSLTQGLEQGLPDRLPSPAKSLIHNSLSKISEELELLNSHLPSPVASAKACFQMPRFSAGRGAVGM